MLKASNAFREKFEADDGNGTSDNLLQESTAVDKRKPIEAEEDHHNLEHNPAKTVLVVDDDPVTRRQLRRHLEKLKLSVVEVSDGPSAVQLYQEGKRFCLVLMDYEMPDMNGLLATRKIRSYDNDVIVVGSTIHDPATKQDEFLKAGANLVDIKPISAERLQELISEYNLAASE
jgi:CheY-like chemotaxis protein